MNLLKTRSVNAVILLILFLFAILSCCENGSQAARPFLVLYAFSAEGELLAGLMDIKSTDQLLGRRIEVGILAGKDIVLAESGVGMNNAAMMTQALIDRYQPGGVLFTGIAGAIDSSVNIGDIVICDTWISHDYGYFGKEGFRLKEMASYNHNLDSILRKSDFEVDQSLLSSARELSQTGFEFEKIGDRKPILKIGGVGVSGNQFIDSREKRLWLSAQFGALVTDMESAAVAQVCTANGVPFIIFRSASDLAGGSGSETGHAEMEQFFKIAADNSSKVVVGFVSRL